MFNINNYSNLQSNNEKYKIIIVWLYNYYYIITRKKTLSPKYKGLNYTAIDLS